MSGIIPSVKHISGTGTPRIAIVYQAPQFTSGTSTTFGAHSAVDANNTAPSALRVNQRIASYSMRGTVQIPTFAKIVNYDSTNGITVDAWTNGTPTNGQIFTIDGYVVDLPRTQDMTETYDPDVFIQNLWDGNGGVRVETEMRGWKYDCVLDYSKYMSPDDILAMKNVLAQAANDDLILIPRRDCPQFQYNVYYSNAIQISKYGVAPGYRKLVFALRSKTNLPSWGMVSGHGTNYGNDYGNTGW